VVGDHDARVQGEAVAPGTQAVAAAHAATSGGRGSPGGRSLGLELREQLWRRIGKGRVVGRLAVEPTRYPTHHPIEDRQQVAASGRREQPERQLGTGLGEHTVGDEEVEVDVEIDQAAEALGERDRPGPWCRDATRACTATLPGADRADDEAADPACPGWIAGEAQAQRLGYGQHPLAVRRGRQDVIYENPRDPLINEALRKACERINRRELRRNNRKLRFVVETSPTKRDRFD
jgi:hypothetical protein